MELEPPRGIDAKKVADNWSRTINTKTVEQCPQQVDEGRADKLDDAEH